MIERLDVQIRRGGYADIPIITRNNIAMARETEGKILDPISATQGVDGLLHDPAKGFYLLAERGDRIIGQCMVTYEWSDWRNGTFWWIQSVYVDEGYRKKGVFNSLYLELLHMAQEQSDVAGLRLYVDRTNRLAQKVYRHQGMKKTGYRIFEVEFRKNMD